MIRLTLFTIFISYFSIRAFKDWYLSLCVLIVLTAIIEHPDVPKNIAGIQGLNPWNILLLFVGLGWLSSKRHEMHSRGLPTNIKTLIILYLGICVVSYFRLTTDITPIAEWNKIMGSDPPTSLGLFSEHVVNALKWVIPGILLFNGCNSSKRLRQGVLAILAFGLVIALLTIKAMPIGALTTGDQLQHLALKLLSSNVGYHRVNIAMMMAGFFWSFFAYREVLQKAHQKYIYFIIFIIFYALALTGGRTGYVTWGLLGMMFAALKWRRIFFIAPVVVMLVVTLVPAAKERLLMGFDENTVDRPSEELLQDDLNYNSSGVDLYTVTSGRTSAWPFVLEKIREAPLIGYGKEAMIRTGTTSFLYETYGEAFPHPHNMYLQWLLDNGIIGFLPILLFYILIIKYSIGLLLDKSNINYVMIGGVCLSLVLAVLIAGMGSQTFYPREGSVAMWGAVFLMLRVYVERSNHGMLWQDSEGELPEEGSEDKQLRKSFYV